MQRFIVASAAYAGLGLAGGLYYRTLTHSVGFTGDSQLGLVHTHFLVLGFVGFLLFAVLERLFGLTRFRTARWSELAWHAGLLVTGGMMAVKGTLTVLGAAVNEKALAGISGTGHILLTAALVLLCAALIKATAATSAKVTA